MSSQSLDQTALHSECVTTAVCGADPGTPRDAGAVRGAGRCSPTTGAAFPAGGQQKIPVHFFSGRPHLFPRPGLNTTLLINVTPVKSAHSLLSECISWFTFALLSFFSAGFKSKTCFFFFQVISSVSGLVFFGSQCDSRRYT